MNYQVDLDVFSGPMDLLLYLIAREEVDIQEVSISRIVDQYLDFMQQLKELDVEIGSDFLVMASTLILIKSKALLPKEEIDLEEEIDGQDELIQHLLEYKKIKMLSRALQERADRHGLRVSRHAQLGLPMEESFSDEDLNLWDIIQAFSKIVKETGLDQNFSVIHSEKPISEYINLIVDKLIDRSRVLFEDLFAAERTRSEAICNFISLLELARRRVIKVGFNEEVSDLEVVLCWDADELRSIKEDGIYKLSELFRDFDEGLRSLDGAGVETTGEDTAEPTPEAPELIHEAPDPAASTQASEKASPDPMDAEPQEEHRGETDFGDESIDTGAEPSEAEIEPIETNRPDRADGDVDDDGESRAGDLTAEGGAV